MKSLSLSPVVRVALQEAAEVHYDRVRVSRHEMRKLALHLIRVGAEAIVRDDMRCYRKLSLVRFEEPRPAEDVDQLLEGVDFDRVWSSDSWD